MTQQPPQKTLRLAGEERQFPPQVNPIEIVNEDGVTIDYAVGPSGEMLPGSVDTAELAASAVTTAKIADGAVTAAKLEPAADLVNGVGLRAHFAYDFAVDGGAQGAIALRGEAIPNHAAVSKIVVKVITALHSGGAATAALSVEGANDVVTADTLANTDFDDATKFTVLAPGVSAVFGTALNPLAAAILTTAARIPHLTIAVADLDAGKFEMWVYYDVFTP